MVLLITQTNFNDKTKLIHSNKAIDVNAFRTTLSNQSNCQPENDVENFGLLQNNNGKTISINSKQTKMHRNAIHNEQRPCDTVLNNSVRFVTRFLQQFHVQRSQQQQQQQDLKQQKQKQKQQRRKNPFDIGRHSNKMQLIAILLCYVVVFSIQTATARPNVNRNSDTDSESNWEGVALSSENKVSLIFTYVL